MFFLLKKMSIIFVQKRKDFSDFFYKGYYPDFQQFIKATFGKGTRITFFLNGQQKETVEYDTVYVEVTYQIITLTFTKEGKKQYPYFCNGFITKKNRLRSLSFSTQSKEVVDYKVDGKKPTPISLTLPSHYTRVTLCKGSTIYRQSKREEREKESLFFSDDINYPFKSVSSAFAKQQGDIVGLYKYVLKKDIKLVYLNTSWRCDVYIKNKNDPKSQENIDSGIDDCANDSKLENDFLAACLQAGLDGFKAAVQRDQLTDGKKIVPSFENAKNVRYEIMLHKPSTKVCKLVDDPVWEKKYEDAPLKKKRKTSFLLF